jgi:hypothetical protein
MITPIIDKGQTRDPLQSVQMALAGILISLQGSDIYLKLFERQPLKGNSYDMNFRLPQEASKTGVTKIIKHAAVESDWSVPRRHRKSRRNSRPEFGTTEPLPNTGFRRTPASLRHQMRNGP